MATARRTPTIQDVALAAQVSAATVSRVLTAPERVAAATRERVQAAVLATGYTVNQAARSLRLRSARTILLAAPNIANPFYSIILDAAIVAAAARGYSVMVTSRIGADPNRWLHDYLLSTRADGLLLLDGSLDTSRLHNLGAGGIELPLVAAYDEWPDPAIASVLTDNREAAMRAVRHLIAIGHTEIAHIVGPSQHRDQENERLVGYRAAMAEAGLPVREEWLFQGNYEVASGTAAGSHYLTLANRPTAIFAGNDEMALGLIHRLKRDGVVCPTDISVVGFDDTAVAAYYDPPLTTMRQPREEIGRAAINELIDQIEGARPPANPVHIVLRSTLVVRESTAPPPGRG
jgi:LacI family transcriptional regulator, repressor for deo operon, udp, cdd, tsx, nupC, and nupG